MPPRSSTEFPILSLLEDPVSSDELILKDEDIQPLAAQNLVYRLFIPLMSGEKLHDHSVLPPTAQTIYVKTKLPCSYNLRVNQQVNLAVNGLYASI